MESVDAFIEAAAGEPESPSIQVGFYQLKKEMPAADALDVLVDPDNLRQEHGDRPRGPAGRRDRRRCSPRRPTSPQGQFEKVLDEPGRARAARVRQGQRRRATCSRRPTTSARTTTPVDMLKTMVARWQQAADDADLEAGRRGARLHPARADDRRQPGRGRGPRRRHAQGRPGHLQPARDDANPTDGLLQIDATVNYALGASLGVGADHRGRLRGRLAVQHLQERRPAAGADRGAGRRGDRGRREPRPTGPGSST